jgi:glutathione S-transferase
MSECFATMDYLSTISEFNTLTRVASQTIGAVMMYLVVALKTKPALKIDDPREALRAACGEIIVELKRSHGRKFLGGDGVDRADLAAFGVLRSIEGQDTFKAAMELAELKQWYDRVAAAVGPSSRI